MVIVYPENWREAGQQINLEKITELILQILQEIPCNCLALSGGIDSSLLLNFMLKIHRKIKAFTIGLSENHPDIKYAKMIADRYPRVIHKIYIPWAAKIESEKQADDFPGDTVVRLFYRFVNIHTDGIIAGDGIDEFMCGYYEHQRSQNEEIYYAYIRRLNKEHLIPLDRNSGEVKVYLPFLDKRLLFLLSQIPIFEKVDNNHRKKLMVEMAKECLPDELIKRRKYGFCDAFEIKGGTYD